jgi:membrane protease YdiL (CAAX protease family)
VAATPAAAVLAFVAILILLAGFWAWLIACARAAVTWRLVGDFAAARIASLLQSFGISSRLPLIAWESRRPVPWAFVDLVILLGTAFCVSLAMVKLNHRFHWLPDSKTSHVASLPDHRLNIIEGMAIRLGIILCGAAMIMVRTGARLGDFGLSWRRLISDLRLGLVGFVMLTPPVYAIQGVLVSYWKESKHPVIEMFKATPDARFFELLFISVAIVTPLFEEFIFRVLLQGFFEKVATDHGNIQSLLLGDEHSGEAKESGTQSELRGPKAFLPIVISTLVFALLHFPNGPDWIPLMLLAGGMGYLYQRTHRFVPVLVVHSLLNALSMWGVWVTVHQPPAS